MRTWSAEELFVKAYSTAAVAVQGVIDVFTHRPGYSNAPIPGCPNASDCREYGCAGNCSEASEADERLSDKEAEEEVTEPPGYGDEWHEQQGEWAKQQNAKPPTLTVCGTQFGGRCTKACEEPNAFEPSLSDDELVAVRQLIEERFPFQAVDCGLGSPPAASAAGSSGEEVARVNPPDVPSSPRSSDGDCFDHCVGHPDDAAADWIGGAVPKIRAVMEAHTPYRSLFEKPVREIHCGDRDQREHATFSDWWSWREHVAPLIAEAVAPYWIDW